MEMLRKPLPALAAREKYLGVAYLIFQFLFLPVLLQLVGGVFSISISDALYNFLYFSINFICVIAIFSSFLKKNILRASRNQQQMLTAAAMGFGLYWLCSTLMGVAIQALFPEFTNLNDGELISIFGSYPLLMFLGTVILAPVAEEVLHRGLVFGALYEKNPWVAYIFSALLFAAIHVVQYIGLYSPLYVVVALVQYLPAGLIFAWSYQKCGCIFAPIAIHIINNLLAFCFVR